MNTAKFEKAVHEYVHMSKAHAAEFGFELVDRDFEQKFIKESRDLTTGAVKIENRLMRFPLTD